MPMFNQSPVSGALARLNRGCLQRGVRRWAGQTTEFTGYQNNTFQMVVELPCASAKLRSVRFAVPSNSLGSVDLKVAVASGQAFNDLTGSSGFGYAGFDGSDHGAFVSFSIPQKVQKHPTEYWSDWVTISPAARNDGGMWATVWLRAYVTSANVTLNLNAYSDNGFYAKTFPGLRHRMTNQAGDFTTTNWAGYNASPAYSGATPFTAVEFLYETDDNRVYSVAHYTDSIGNGYGTSLRGSGPMVHACESLNADAVAANSSFRFSPMNGCLSGDMVEYTYRRFQQHIKNGAGIPDIAIFRPYTTNNGGNESKAYPYAYAFLNDCRRLGIVPVFDLGIWEGLNPSRNAVGDAVAVKIKALASVENCPVIDTRSVFSAANATGNFAEGAGLEVHPNDAGQPLLVPYFKSAILAAKVLVL